MKRLLLSLALLATLAVQGAQIWTVNTVDDLVWLNANTINTNVFAVNGLTQGDGLGGLWSFFRGDVSATNTVANGGPVESVNPVSPAGRWIKTLGGSSLDPGATNVFNTIYVTNIVFANIIVVTNLYVTTNTYVINNGSTNTEGLWISTNGVYHQVFSTEPVEIDSRIYFGADTNVFYLSSFNTLSYSNGIPTIQLEETGVGTTTTISQQGGVGALSAAGGLNLTGQGGTWVIGATGMYPNARDYSLGLRFLPVGNFISTNYIIQGYYDSGSGDYSSLNISQTSSNLARIDSQSSGISGGQPAPIAMLFNGTNLFQFDRLGQITLGPGASNVLYRSGANLIYTNTQPKFLVQRGAANISLDAINGVPTLDGSGPLSVGQSLITHAIQPNGDNTYDLGANSNTGAWKDIFNKGKVYVEGTNDGAGNTSWLRVFVTNGVAVLDLANAGTGPAPSSISFRTNGVEVGHFP